MKSETVCKRCIRYKTRIGEQGLSLGPYDYTFDATRGVIFDVGNGEYLPVTNCVERCCFELEHMMSEKIQ